MTALPQRDQFAVTMYLRLYPTGEVFVAPLGVDLLDFNPENPNWLRLEALEDLLRFRYIPTEEAPP